MVEIKVVIREKQVAKMGIHTECLILDYAYGGGCFHAIFEVEVPEDWRKTEADWIAQKALQY